jgi:hypothetical protein
MPSRRRTQKASRIANIVIGAAEHAGRVKVFDFGIAKLDESSRPLSERADDHHRRPCGRHRRLHVA